MGWGALLVGGIIGPSGVHVPIALIETMVPEAGRALPQAPSVGFAVMLAALLVGVGAAVVRRHGFARGPSLRPGPRDGPDRSAGRPPGGASEEPRTDDDRVEALLGERGGRVHQTAIVESMGWSKSKVSLLLTEMEAEGRIRKVRIGRENLILLPGTEPDVVLEDADG
ncbi:MAG: hypothetical protein R3324_00020 [Halobacteriales archaeon]|nr:hypothetical protein [Halobacteriales archaeon]